MNLENQNGKELLNFLMSDVGSTRVAPTNLSSADLHACRLLLRRSLERDIEQAKDRAYRRGFQAGAETERAAQLEDSAAQPPHSPFSPQWETVEGAKTLLKNIGSTLLVGWMLQFFIPFLKDWPTALVVLEVVRGPLKVGGDFVYTASLSRTSSERVSLQARLRFCAMFACVLALFSLGTNLMTQVGGELFLQLIAGKAMVLHTIEVSKRDLFTSFVIALFSGFIALYLQSFVIKASIQFTEARIESRNERVRREQRGKIKVVTQQMRTSWLTTRRSYVRMFANYFVPFVLATLFV